MGLFSDVSQFYRLFEGRVEAMHARFETHRYPRHAHEHLVVGLIRDGAQSYSYRGTRHVTPAGSSFLVNAEEPHTGESADGKVYQLYSLYPKGSLMEELARDLGCNGAPYFKEAVVDDSVLSYRLTKAHHALRASKPRSECEQLVMSALSWLIGRHSQPASHRLPDGHESMRIRVARDIIEERFAEDLSLGELAALVSLSPYYFARTFQREVGLPPHTYLENVRIRKACEITNIAAVGSQGRRAFGTEHHPVSALDAD